MRRRSTRCRDAQFARTGKWPASRQSAIQPTVSLNFYSTAAERVLSLDRCCATVPVRESSGVLNDARWALVVRACATLAWRAAWQLACCLAATLLLSARPAAAQVDRDLAKPVASQIDINLPEPSVDEPVTIAADRATHWTQGSYEVWHIQGSCLISQGLIYARAAEGVIWVERGGSNGDPTPTKVIAYLEGKVTIDYQTGTDGIVKRDKALLAKINEKTWLGRFSTTAPLKTEVSRGRTRARRKASDL